MPRQKNIFKYFLALLGRSIGILTGCKLIRVDCFGGRNTGVVFQGSEISSSYIRGFTVDPPSYLSVTHANALGELVNW